MAMEEKEERKRFQSDVNSKQCGGIGSLPHNQSSEGRLKSTMDRSSRGNRHYTATTLTTLREEYNIAQNRDLLLALYEQVVCIWKELVGVRFKLLGLVPAVSLALLVTVLSPKGPAEGLSQASKLLIGVFGLSTVFGLFVYDRRNSALHDDLISRGRKIEDELGVDTGIFRGRLKASGIFKHDIATNLIYASSMLAWTVAIVLIAFSL
jgi:hypothetical protein